MKYDGVGWPVAGETEGTAGMACGRQGSSRRVRRCFYICSVSENEERDKDGGGRGSRIRLDRGVQPGPASAAMHPFIAAKKHARPRKSRKYTSRPAVRTQHHEIRCRYLCSIPCRSRSGDRYGKKSMNAAYRGKSQVRSAVLRERPGGPSGARSSRHKASVAFYHILRSLRCSKNTHVAITRSSIGRTTSSTSMAPPLPCAICTGLGKRTRNTINGLSPASCSCSN